MARSLMAFTAGLVLGASVMALASSRGQARGTPASGSSIVQLRLYTIDKGKLDDFAAAWRAGVYPLRTSLGYKIPFAAKIPETNQFVWLMTYDGPESWDKKEEQYYASNARTSMKPDPAQLI